MRTTEQKDKLKQIGTIATATAAIVTAVVALVREPAEPRARASYDVLAKKVEELQASTKLQHDDTVALRGYLDGYLKSLREGQKDLSAATEAVSVVANAPRLRVSTPAAPPVKVPPPPSIPKANEPPELAAPPEFGQLP